MLCDQLKLAPPPRPRFFTSVEPGRLDSTGTNPDADGIRSVETVVTEVKAVSVSVLVGAVLVVVVTIVEVDVAVLVLVEATKVEVLVTLTVEVDVDVEAVEVTVFVTVEVQAVVKVVHSVVGPPRGLHVLREV